MSWWRRREWYFTSRVLSTGAPAASQRRQLWQLYGEHGAEGGLVVLVIRCAAVAWWQWCCISASALCRRCRTDVQRRLVTRPPCRWPPSGIATFGFCLAGVRFTELIHKAWNVPAPPILSAFDCTLSWNSCLAVLAFKCLHGTAPSYLVNEYLRSLDLEDRGRLRSASSLLIVRRTPVAECRSFRSLLLVSVTNYHVTSRLCAVPSISSSRLKKTHLFDRFSLVLKWLLVAFVAYIFTHLPSLSPT